MKKAKLIFAAICAAFAMVLVVGCQNAASGNNNSGGGSGSGGSGSGGSSTGSYAPFAGTTWVYAPDSEDPSYDVVITFGSNGVATSAQLFSATDTYDYKYTVSSDGDSRIAIVKGHPKDPDLVGIMPPVNTLKFVIASADATTGQSYQPELIGDGWETDPDPYTYTKQ